MKIIALHSKTEVERGDKLWGHRYYATFIMNGTIQFCTIILTVDQEQPSKDVVLCENIEEAIKVTQAVIDSED
jgi:hypothetical protein